MTNMNYFRIFDLEVIFKLNETIIYIDFNEAFV